MIEIKAVLNQNTYNRLRMENKLDANIFYCIDNKCLDGAITVTEIDDIDAEVTNE